MVEESMCKFQDSYRQVEYCREQLLIKNVSEKKEIILLLTQYQTFVLANTSNSIGLL